jgi:hypothetical protein
MRFGERESLESDSDSYLEQLQKRIYEEKAYLKKSWRELKCALDLLYLVSLVF